MNKEKPECKENYELEDVFFEKNDQNDKKKITGLKMKDMKHIIIMSDDGTDKKPPTHLHEYSRKSLEKMHNAGHHDRFLEYHKKQLTKNGLIIEAAPFDR